MKQSFPMQQQENGSRQYRVSQMSRQFIKMGAANFVTQSEIQLPHNKGMQSDQNARYALILTADAKR
jgi:hypothetical protein